LPVGDRRYDSAKQVWTALPVVYREQAPLYTDQYAVDLGVMPAAQSQASTQHARTTNYRARFGQFQAPDDSSLKLYSSPLMVDVV